MNDLVKIIFTGTGSGKTSLNRFHSSFIIDNTNYKLLVDAGDSVSRALIKSEIDINGINGIIITHFHPDHICGLPSLLIQMKMLKRVNPLKIFVHSSLETDLKKLLISTYVIPDRLNFELQIICYNFNNEIKIDNDFSIRTFENSHLSKYKYFMKSEKISLASASLLFSVGGKTVFYSGDLGDGKDFDFLDGSKIDVFISETTHISPEVIVKTAEEQKSDIVVFTHINEEIEEELTIYLQNHQGKPALLEAFDGMELVL